MREVDGCGEAGVGKYCAYLTVSTGDRVEGRVELAAQEAACRSHAERNESSLFAVFMDEGVAGLDGLGKRPALLEAIGQLDKGDLLLVPARDVLGSDPIDAAVIESAVMRKGARIIPVTGGETEEKVPSNGLKRRIVDAFAEYEELAAGVRKEKVIRRREDREKLIEMRRRLWQNSWNSLLEVIERPQDDGSGSCDGGSGT